MAETPDDLRREIALEIERRASSWRQVSLDAGLADATLKHFLSAKTQKLRRGNAVAIAHALGWPEERLLRPFGYPQSPSRPPATSVVVPLVSVRVTAGMDTWEPSGEAVTIDAEAARGRDLVAMIVTGDCMVPDVQPGDTVFVDRNERLPIVGDLIVLATEGGPILKRYDMEDGRPILRDGNRQGYRPNGARLVGIVFEVRRRLRRAT
jgi:lambda repressor-like predicted transcriptional regulator